MRVLIAGRHELAASVLRAAHRRHEVTFVRPARERACRGPSATETANELRIPQVDDVGSPSLASCVDAVRPDILLSLGYDRILKQSVLDAVSLGANVHFGALPRYRGSWSIPHAILAGDPFIGVTLHALHAGIDDGPVIAQTLVPDAGDLSCAEIYDRAVDAGMALALSWLDALKSGRRPVATPQDEAQATYFPPEFPGQFRINWRQAWTQVSRYIRACTFPPLPSAHSMLGDVTIEFAWPVDKLLGSAPARSGTIVEAEGRFGVAILNGIVCPGLVRVDGQDVRFDDLARTSGLEGQRLS